MDTNTKSQARAQMEWTDHTDDLRVLQQKLVQDLEGDFGPPERKPFAWVIRGVQREVVAGVSGFVHWKWAYISQLWVNETLRGRGFGPQLLQQVRDWGKTQNLTGVYIDTFSVKVKSFYEKQGFTLGGSIPEFPVGSTRYFLYRHFADRK